MPGSPSVLLRRRTAPLGAAAAALAWPPRALADARPAAPRWFVVRQPSLAASTGFAQAWRHPSLDAADVAELLYGALPSVWRQPQALLTGLTDAAWAFCIERVAFEHGWRTLWRTAAEPADALGGRALVREAHHHLASPQPWRAQPLHAGMQTPAPRQAWLMAPRSRFAAAPAAAL